MWTGIRAILALNATGIGCYSVTTEIRFISPCNIRRVGILVLDSSTRARVGAAAVLVLGKYSTVSAHSHNRFKVTVI